MNSATTGTIMLQTLGRMGAACLAVLLLAALQACATFQTQAPAPPAQEVKAPAQDNAAAAQAPPPRIVEVPAQGPLKISLAEAGLIALENNRSLKVERFNPEIHRTYEDQAQAVFDPVLEAELSADKTSSKKISSSTGRITDSDSTAFEAQASLRKYFPSGAFLEAQLSSAITDSSQYQDPFYSNRLGLTVGQSLLQGRGEEVNLVQVRQTRLDTAIQEYELRGFIELLLAEVENAYWDYALSRRRIEIVEESLRLARQQLDETQEMITVGSLAESELAAVEAEVASQKQDLINAKSTREKNRLKLLKLLNPPGEPLWNREVELVHPPALPGIAIQEIELHVAKALRRRPEINQARLKISQNDLELVKTRNGLLPKLDAFITLGKTGYSDSFGGSLSDLPKDSYDALLGFSLEYPLFNREAKAAHKRSVLNRDQVEKALDNLAQVVELDVRTAYLEVERTREQIAASTATRNLQEEKLRIETEKFKVGRSTNLLVAQAQRDLLQSRINEVQAVVDHLKALTDFFRLEGTLLTRRSITAPGEAPVEGP